MKSLFVPSVSVWPQSIYQLASFLTFTLQRQANTEAAREQQHRPIAFEFLRSFFCCCSFRYSNLSRLVQSPKQWWTQVRIPAFPVLTMKVMVLWTKTFQWVHAGRARLFRPLRRAKPQWCKIVLLNPTTGVMKPRKKPMTCGRGRDQKWRWDFRLLNSHPWKGSTSK